MFVNETHLNQSVTDHDVCIPGYVLYRNDRTDRGGGGTAVYVSEKLKVKHRSDLDAQSNIESCWIELCGKTDLILGTIYRAPNENANYYDNILDMIEAVSTEGKEMIILGDLNFDYLKKPSSNSIENIENLFDMKQIIEQPTRESLLTNASTGTINKTSTLIDVILTTAPNRHTKTSVEKLTLSDHYMIKTQYSHGPVQQHHNEIEFRSYKSYDMNEFINEIKDSNILDNIRSVKSMTEAWDIFKQKFELICNNHAPLSKARLKSRKSPWITKEIIQIMYRRDYVHKKAIQLEDSDLWSEYKMLRNQVTSMIRNAKREYYELHLIGEQNENNIWKILHTILPSKYSLHDSNTDLSADDFCNHFSEIGHKTAETVHNDSNDLPWKGPTSQHCFKFQEITESSVLKFMEKLPSKSSLDVLNWDSKLMKDAKLQLTPILTYLFNKSQKSSTIPDDWKLARVSPVYKGAGSKSEMVNYRPISSISHIGKLMEKCVNEQLRKYLENHQFISPDQSAYRPNHSTTTSLHRVTEDWLESINDGDVIVACFLDIKKCFDTINHQILLKKLNFYGIKGKELEWFRSYLHNRKIIVSFKNAKSNPKLMTIGIPQGAVLGPLLFIIYANDLSNFVNNNTLNQFADDALLYAAGKNLQEAQCKVQEGLNGVSNWYSGNDLGLNTTKTVGMVIRNRITEDDKITLKINNTIIKQVTDTAYLGTQMDETLSFKQHMIYLNRSVQPKLVALRKLKPILPNDTLIKVYKSTIEPVIDYTSTVWGSSGKHVVDKAQRLQNMACRIITGNYDFRNTRGIDLVNKLEMQTFEQRLQYNYSVLMYKILHGISPNYLSDLVVMEQDVHDYQLRGHELDIYLPKVNVEKYRQSLMYSGGQVWNNLNNHLKNINTVNTFKRQYKAAYF